MAGFRRGDAAFVVGAVSVAHFLSHVFLLAYPPLFPLLASDFGVSTTQLGLLVTAIYVPQLLLQVPLGGVVDRAGGKRVLVAGLLVTSVAIGASGLATAYWQLLAFALLSGIGQSVFHPADYALLETVTTPDNEGLGFSVHTFGGYAGFAAAPLTIGAVALTIGWQPALLAAGVVGVVVALAIAATTEPVHAERIIKGDEMDAEPDDADRTAERDEEEGGVVREFTAYLTRPTLLLVFVFYLFSMMALVGLQSFTTVYAVDAYGLTESTANTLLSVHLTATAVGVLLGGPLADRVPYRPVVVGSILLGALGVVAIVAAPGAGLAVAFSLFTLVGLLFGLALPSRDKFANAAADPEAVGKSFGFFFTGLSLGAVVSPTLIGAVIDGVSAPAGFLTVAGFLVVAAGIVVVAARRQ